MEIATLSRGLMGNPNSPSLQTIYRRWNQSRGVFYWVNAVSYRMCASTMIIPEEKHTWFSSESPESLTRKEKGQWVLLPSRSLIPWMVAWLMVKCRIRLVSFDKHPFYLIMTCLSEYEKKPWRVPGLLTAIATESVTTHDLRSPLCSFFFPSLTHPCPHGL